MAPKRRKTEDDSLAASTDEAPSAGVANIGRRNWNQSFEALIFYREAYGDCLVPSQYPEDSALGHWVRKQRRNENEGRLSSEKKQLLDDIGFVWKLRSVEDQSNKAEDTEPPKKRTWKEHYKALVDFQEETGHLAVNNDVALSQWITKQRQDHDKLTRRQKSLLLDIPGFDFELKSEKVERTWHDKFNELKRFQTKYGHTKVPDPCEEFPGLGTWANEQRRLWRGKRLRAKRVRDLESIGFEKAAVTSPASPKNALGQTNKQRLLSTPSPPKKEKPPKEKDSPPSERKIPRMSNKKKFLTRFKALCAFQEEFGHTNPPRKEFQTLSYWVQRQKQLYQQDKLKAERRQLLDSIGFDWSLGPSNTNNNQRHFFDMLSKLSLFQSHYGHLQVPKDYDRSGLAEWVDEIKQLGREGRLESLHAERLLRIGFTWEEDIEVWMELFGYVNQAVETFHWDSRMSLQLSEDLENWVKVQLLLLDYDLLTPKRKNMFEALSLGVQKSKIVIKKNPQLEEFQLKIETTPEQGQWNGLNLKTAALSWNPNGATSKIVGREPKGSPVTGKRKKVPGADLGSAAKKLKNGQRSTMDPGVMITSTLLAS